MPSFAGLSKFFGRTASEGAAFAAGVAVAPALSPVVREIVNEANSKYQTHPIDAQTAAAIVAEDVERFDFGKAEASFNGVSEERFRALLGETLNAPGVPLLLTLWRRNEIGDGDFLHGLRKAKLEGRWDAPLRELKTERLDPAIIATAIQRGVMQAPFPLPYDPTVGAGNVKPFPVSPLDAAAEAEAHGIDAERLRVETALVGLPMALDRAARARFRNIIEDNDFLRAVLEGNARGEWAAAELEVAREILTAHDYTELELRGFSSRDERLVDTSKHGMSEADSDKLYDVLGRAPAEHTVVIGLARGANYPGSYANVPEPYRSAIQRSNIREEWAEIVYAARYAYPSAFVLRSLAEAGELGDTKAVETILLEIGWKPELAAQVAGKWVPAGAATGKHASKAETSLYTALHRSYVAAEISEATVRENLTLLDVDAAEQQKVLDLWSAERSFVRKQLSPAEIRKLTAKGDVNLATGQPWTTQEAVAALLERGYSADEARMFLEL